VGLPRYGNRRLWLAGVQPVSAIPHDTGGTSAVLLSSVTFAVGHGYEGYVVQRTVQVGQQVTPGQGLLVIIPLDQVWVTANFKETGLGRMRIGQPSHLNADIYGGGVTYQGTVLGLSPGTGSVFELLPPQNATGNFIKVVQRVPVRIGLRAEDVEAHPIWLNLDDLKRIGTRIQ
jgi:membrane fusion protein (multidrug efflux system)